MIARHWRGWTRREDADAYEALLNEKALPGLRQIGGYRGGYVLRCDGEDETEFVVVNFFDSLNAVKRFAGEDYMVPVFEPESRKLLSKVEPIARHYEVRGRVRPRAASLVPLEVPSRGGRSRQPGQPRYGITY
jgi:heme-degrading monooxygenase HmoA